VPDPAALRGRGRRERRNRRLVLATVAAATAAVVATGAVVAASSGMLHKADEKQPAKPIPSYKVLSPLEQKVLDRVPDAHRVDGEVIVPGPVDPRAEVAFRLSAPAGRIAPLGWHGYEDFRGIPFRTTQRYPAFLTSPVPDDADVWADAGPLHLGCHRTSATTCNLLQLVRSQHAGWFSIMRDPAWMHLGDQQFLKPGAPMQVFPGSTFAGNRVRPTVIGGVHGTTTERVELALRDGTIAEATVDSGRIAPGSTLFWSLTDSPVVRATAYDRAGTVVEDHKLTACYSRVDCQIR
jgi:hypothetical protein